MLRYHPTWPTGLSPADIDQVLVVVSDIEIGAGGPTDDFPQSEKLAQLLLSYLEAPAFAHVKKTFVFNGDTFDFLKTSLSDGSYPTLITANMALEKLERMRSAHEPFFEALAALACDARCEVRFVIGNHDAELAFPELKQRLSRLGRNLRVDGLSVDIGDVHIEHGQQFDPTFRMDPRRLLTEVADDQVINLAWGSLALLEVAMPLHPLLHPFDRVRPRTTALECFPEVKELLLRKYWDYWTREFWKRRDDSGLHRVSWTMLREIAYRFGSRDPDVSAFDPAQIAARNPAARLHIVGHLHTPGLWDRDGLRVLQTGCFRNEFYFDPVETQQRFPSTYAEAYLTKNKVRRSRLVEVDIPPPEEVPGDLRRFVPIIRQLLDAEANSSHAQALQSKEEVQSELPRASPVRFVQTLRDSLRKKIEPTS